MGCVNSKGGDQNAPQEPLANSQNSDIHQHRPQAGGARTPIALDAVAPALATADDALASGNVIIDPSATVGKGCKIGPDVVIGAGCVVTAGTLRV